MRRIKGKDTLPELAVRRLIHRLGYRYRLHRTALPGRPDLVFPGRKKVVFVHGCFWHQHAECASDRVPHANSQYWAPKLTRNVARDAAHRVALQSAGWEVLVVWECEIDEGENAELADRLISFLG
jgi:DNA mismatch endonuclease, patch repair protein